MLCFSFVCLNLIFAIHICRLKELLMLHTTRKTWSSLFWTSFWLVQKLQLLLYVGHCSIWWFILMFKVSSHKQFCNFLGIIGVQIVAYESGDCMCLFRPVSKTESLDHPLWPMTSPWCAPKYFAAEINSVQWEVVNVWLLHEI